MRGVIRNPRKDRLRLPPRSHEDLYVLVQSRTTEIFRSACVGAAQIKKSLVWIQARPSAARSGNGARRGRRYAPLLCCGRPPDYAKESRPGGLAHSGSPPPLVIDQTNRPRSMPLNESNGPSTPSFDSDGRHRSHETRPLLLRKKPCLFPSLLGNLTSISAGPWVELIVSCATSINDGSLMSIDLDSFPLPNYE